MQVQFISSFAPITADPAASRALYVDALGLPLDGEDDYIHSENIGGSKHFGVWPLTQAAQSCYGTDEWPAGTPVPHASVEFEVGTPEEVQQAADELTDKGYELVHGSKVEPWGQSVARLLSPEQVLVGISFAPWMHGA